MAVALRNTTPIGIVTEWTRNTQNMANKNKLPQKQYHYLK